MSGPIFYAIPVGTPAAVCKNADCRNPIYYVLTGKGARMPVDAEVEGGKPPTKMLPGQGVPHWGTCVGAKDFKKKKPAGSQA
jgi:hypothetical protein